MALDVLSDTLDVLDRMSKTHASREYLKFLPLVGSALDKFPLKIRRNHLSFYP
jgi:hypothetical protein